MLLSNFLVVSIEAKNKLRSKMKAKLRKIGNTKRNKQVNDMSIKYRQLGFLILQEMVRNELQTYLSRTGLLRTR